MHADPLTSILLVYILHMYSALINTTSSTHHIHIASRMFAVALVPITLSSSASGEAHRQCVFAAIEAVRVDRIKQAVSGFAEAPTTTEIRSVAWNKTIIDAVYGWSKYIKHFHPNDIEARYTKGVLARHGVEYLITWVCLVLPCPLASLDRPYLISGPAHPRCQRRPCRSQYPSQVVPEVYQPHCRAFDRPRGQPQECSRRPACRRRLPTHTARQGGAQLVASMFRLSIPTQPLLPSDWSAATAPNSWTSRRQWRRRSPPLDEQAA